MYSTVDKSEKITVTNKKYVSHHVLNESQDSESGIPLYAVVDKNKKSHECDELEINEKIEVVDPASGTIKDKESIPDSKNISKTFSVSWLAFVLSVIAIALLVIVITLLIVVFVKIIALESSENSSNISMIDAKVLNLSNIWTEFSYQFQQQNYINDVLNTLSNLSSSCADILFHNLSSSSGYYLVRSSTGQLTSVYCDMTRTCGNITGGWMRVAELDLDSCPTGLISQSFNGTRTCIRSEETPNCTSILYSSLNIQYSKICGRIRGYGVGSVDGFFGRTAQHSMVVTDNYLDGISIAINTDHVWSFVAGRCDSCVIKKPSFIDSDFTCDDNNPICSGEMLCGSILWNTNKCGKTTPVFYKQLSNNITTDINVKVCRNEARNNEDIAVTSIDLYIQ